MADTLQSLGLLKPDFTTLPPDFQGNPGALVNPQAYADALRQQDALAGEGDQPPIDFRQQVARVLQAYGGGQGQADAGIDLPAASSRQAAAPQRQEQGIASGGPGSAALPGAQNASGAIADPDSPAASAPLLTNPDFNAAVLGMINNGRSAQDIRDFAVAQKRDPSLFRNLDEAVAAHHADRVVTYQPPTNMVEATVHVANAPDGAAGGDKPPESWWNTLKSYGSRVAAITPVTDALINGRNFFDSLQDDAAGVVDGVAQLPATLLHLGGGAVGLVGDKKDADTLRRWGENVGHFAEHLAADPNSSAFGWGKFGGEFASTLPVEEFAPLEWAAQAGKLGRAGKYAKHVDTAFQGALSGLATSGGKDMPQAMIRGAVVPSVVNATVGHGLPLLLTKAGSLADRAGGRKLAVGIRSYIPEESGHAGSEGAAPHAGPAPQVTAPAPVPATRQSPGHLGLAANLAATTNSMATDHSKGERLQELLSNAGTEFINHALESENDGPEDKASAKPKPTGTRLVANAVLRRRASGNMQQGRKSK